MIYKVFCVHDSAADFFMPPLFFKTKGEFLRAFAEAVNDGGKSNIAKYPSQFTAFELGTWDDAKASFDLLKTPLSLGLAIEFVKPKADVAAVKAAQA